MIETRTKKYVMLEFDGISDAIEYWQGIITPEHKSSLNDKESVEFSGGTYEDAIKQAEYGNPEMVKSMFDGVAEINAMIEADGTMEVRDVTGEYFDVADFLSGEPEVFRRNELNDQKPVIPIWVSSAMAWWVSNKSIINRGCGIVSLCDELQKQGFIVELNITDCVKYAGMNYYFKVNVRTDPLDLDTVAFLIANPLFTRRMALGFLEGASGESDCGAYGHPIDFDLESLFGSGFSGFYFVSSSNKNAFHESNFIDLESTKSHIMSMIDQFKENPNQVILG